MKVIGKIFMQIQLFSKTFLVVCYWQNENCEPIVCPPFQKGGTKILKISKRGEPEKNLGWEKPKVGEIIKMKGVEPNFSG